MKVDIKAKIAMAAVCALLTYGIALQFKSVEKNQGQGTISGLRSAELQTLYQKEKEKNEALLSDYTRVTADLEKYKAAANDTNSTAKILKEQLDYAEILAGMKSVKGKGVTLKINDSKYAAQAGESENLYILHDADILMVVNELRDAGAEAISINDERITAISEIRCVGSVVNINHVKVGAPFIINAIGDPDTLESALLFRGGIISQLVGYGFEFDIKKQENITIPAYKGAINFKYATPAEVTGGSE